MQLYTYWRSTAAWRVRIALAMKQVDARLQPVHLVRGGGEQMTPEYRSLNPNATVPTLVTDGGEAILQSLAAIEYLDEVRPQPPLLPGDAVRRARIRSAAQVIACDIHPVNNLRVTTYLKSRFGHSQDDAVEWMRNFMASGLAAYQQAIEPQGRYSFGDAVTLADLCLVPQLYNATRWQLDMTGLERLLAIRDNCMTLEAFADTAPEHQPDAEI